MGMAVREDCIEKKAARRRARMSAEFSVERLGDVVILRYIP